MLENSRERSTLRLVRKPSPHFAFFCLGVLSLFINFRDAIDYYLKYTRSIDDYVKEEVKEYVSMINRLQKDLNIATAKSFSLDSTKKVNEELRKKIKQNKLDFRNELSIDIYGFKKDLTLVRDEPDHIEILYHKIKIADSKILNFFDLAPPQTLPNSFRKVDTELNPKYLEKILQYIFWESQSDGVDGSCWHVPKSILTWKNKNGIQITKTNLIRACDYESGISNPSVEYFFRVDNDSAQWMIQILPDENALHKQKLGAKYLEEILDSTLVSQYYYHK